MGLLMMPFPVISSKIPHKGQAFEARLFSQLHIIPMFLLVKDQELRHFSLLIKIIHLRHMSASELLISTQCSQCYYTKLIQF